MEVSRPIRISIPPAGVAFAESVHGRAFAMEPRTDPYHKLLYVLRGRVTYREDGRRGEVAPAGSLLLVPARSRHVLKDEAPSTLLLLCTGDGFLRAEPEVREVWNRRAAEGRRVVTVSGSWRPRFEQCWRRALLETAVPRPAAATAMRALALEVFVLLARIPTGGDAAPGAEQRVRSVARAMEETFFERWTLDDAAGRAGMSRRHFSSRFRATMQRTFQEHLTEIRLEHAAGLLRGGGHSVAGVVFACGFGDVSNFYRRFRERYGRAPKEWAAGGSVAERG